MSTPPPAADLSGDRVRRLFAGIAPRYDLTNGVISLGLVRSWRAGVVRRVPPGAGPVLDVCTGTGELALTYHRAGRGRVRVTGADFCRPMLDRAEAKARKVGANITWVEADALALPFPADTFGVVTAAMGIRNSADFRRALGEMGRVCRPGGRVAVLEFSTPRARPLRRLYRWYFTRAVPWVGQVLSRSPDRAYAHLPASTEGFPEYDGFAAEMTAVGLADVRYHPFTFGVITLYVGTKPAAAVTPSRG